MASWKPPDSVGPNEHIGRRLFDEPMLKGAAGQPSYSGLSLQHFEETRGDEVSLDRLGASSIDPKVARYLVPRAEAAGRIHKNTKRFDGWAVVTSKELVKERKEGKLSIIASPIENPEPNDNIYHAHVARLGDFSAYQMALHLRHIFTRYGRVEQNKVREETWRDRLWAHPITRWILAKLGL
jgi:hypothetical protein